MRIENNENFGICEECGRPIPLERLMLVPDATLCVPCKRRDEKTTLLKGDSTESLPASRKLMWDEEMEEDDHDIKIRPLDDLSISDIQEIEIDDEGPSDKKPVS